VARHWAVNASPIILLAKVGQISLLVDLPDRVLIPAGVGQEIDEGPGDDPARQWLNGPGAAHVQETGPIVPLVAGWDLGVGESQVLSWAHQHTGTEAIVDDQAARTCALSLGIPVRGTLGVVLLAKKEGLIPLVAPVFAELRSAGIRVDPSLLDTALQLAGEG
jgi:predicted nucleic acid-binding protein